MSDSNVGLGMVPCKKGCRCVECELDAKNKRIGKLEAEVERLRAVASRRRNNLWRLRQRLRQQSSQYRS